MHQRPWVHAKLHSRLCLLTLQTEAGRDGLRGCAGTITVGRRCLACRLEQDEKLSECCGSIHRPLQLPLGTCQSLQPAKAVGRAGCTVGRCISDKGSSMMQRHAAGLLWAPVGLELLQAGGLHARC